jgi:hypothetical protein
MYVKPEDFHKNVRGNKIVLKELAALITVEIQSRSSPPAGFDFRFLIIVAQWLIEQGGYTMTPQGNNPGNVQGTGDAGFFQRPDNREGDAKGVRHPAPEAKFAKYSSMKHATTKKFDVLRDKFSSAYHAVLTGASSDSYANGLYLPGYPNNYATARQAEYVYGMRFRLQQTVPHYILACEDDIKEIDEMAAGLPSSTPAPGESLDYRNNITLNKNMRSVLEQLLDQLKKVQGRVNDNQGVQA